MQLGFQIAAEQSAFEERTAVREVPLPDVRPVADVELETTFVRAAVAWARWRERRRWTSR